MTPLESFLHSLKEKSVSVIGMGVSNTPLIRLLLQHEISVTVRDKNPDSVLKEEFQSKGAVFITGDTYLTDIQEDIIFRTPGVSPNSEGLLRARKLGKKITSEMQEFFNLCPCPVIAVTGSDGKTTTTTLIAKFLEASGRKVFLGGNIGMPLLCQVDDICVEDIAVVELSSFQLMDLHCEPAVAVVTNISPNHLDYHHTMEEYTSAKTQVFLSQSAQHKVIFNADNEASMSLVSLAKGEVQMFSRLGKEAVANLSTDLNEILIKKKDGSKLALPVSEIKLKGVHNIENYMAAMLAVADFCTQEQISQVARSFYGVEHRMQWIREHDGVTYYNDSIGTSPTRTIAGLHSFDHRIILIAGGYDKGIPFTELGVEICKYVKHLVLVGTTAKQISDAVEEGKLAVQGGSDSGLEGELNSICICENFIQAVECASSLALEGDCVVLSPACAAFDQFKNFAERGKCYQDLVQRL